LGSNTGTKNGEICEIMPIFIISASLLSTGARNRMGSSSSSSLPKAAPPTSARDLFDEEFEQRRNEPPPPSSSFSTIPAEVNHPFPPNCFGFFFCGFFI
jgi:hypothetical protein